VQIETNLEICFYEQDEASVFLETNVTGEDDKMAQVLTFCSYCFRQLTNLGQCQVTHELAKGLKGIEYHISQCDDDDMGATLVKPRGHKGRKNFISRLTAIKRPTKDEALEFTHSLESKFWLKAKGFGLLARSVGYYAPMSIYVLIKYLVRKHKSDITFLNKLGEAIGKCGETFLTWDSTKLFTSQNSVASWITSEIFFTEDSESIMEPEKFVRILEKAKTGDAQAQVDVGNRYLAGIGTPKNISKARYWISKAAEQGHPSAQLLIATFWPDDDQ